MNKKLLTADGVPARAGLVVYVSPRYPAFPHPAVEHAERIDALLGGGALSAYAGSIFPHRVLDLAYCYAKRENVR